MLKVVRNRFTSFSTEGLLYVGAVFECFTLEPRKFQGYGKPYCTPEGIYLYTVKPSPHFGRDVICIENVPGFTSIEIHPGNFPKDTHGCTCVGQLEGVNFVGHSEAAFEALLSKITRTGTVQYVDEP